MKKAYDSLGDAETNVIKLDMTLDYLTKTREEKKNKEIDYLIPYQYIKLGKRIIEKSKTIDLAKALVFRYDNDELHQEALKKPLKYYQSYNVCYQCYQIYTFIMKFSQTIPKKSSSSLNLIKNKQKHIRNVIESEIGLLNKDNINDLLADISFYLVKNEMQCDNRVRNIFASMTELNQSLTHSVESPVKIAAVKKTSDPFPEMNLSLKNIQKRRNRRVLSRVSEFYMGKPKKIGKRLVIK